jgi:ubiquinone/menaquinone biosynthesis C-methylase UbiE
MGVSVPQAMRPHGFWGGVSGWMMDRSNASAQDAAFERLDVRSTDAVLEIGYGTGRLARKIAKAAPEGFLGGVDASSLMRAKAQAKTRKFRKRVELKLGDASVLPWPDGTFDKAAALHSFQFWSDPVRALAEIRRVLKPGGLLVLVLQVHGRRPPKWLPNPVSRTRQEIANTLELLAENGFVGTRVDGKVGSSPVITARRA